MAGDSWDFKDLFVFDMANNHQGDVEHGLKVVRGVAEAAKRHGVRGAIKFQYRQLDSFIHGSHKGKSDNKHIGRFLSTRLTRDQYQVLLDEVRAQGLLAMCTPFDEESVDIIVDSGFDLIKVASCSATDWPLLEEVARSGMPTVVSTGGLTLADIDGVVAFLEHRGSEFAIMHCVSIYPIPDEHFQLNQIDTLRRRYPNRTIGWSTHEDPNDTVPVAIAVAKGAQLFERHVGVETDEIKLNAYSSTPEQLDIWLSSYRKAVELCGAAERPEPAKVETESILSLRRGVFARELIRAGTELTLENTYFAMPCSDDQLNSSDWTNGIVAETDLDVDVPVVRSAINVPDNPSYMIIKRSIHEVKALLNEAKIPLNSDFKVEYSHHYGVENFRETGAVLIECVNREYCKKLIVQLPGQKHPPHFHTLKEETFQVLHGVLHASVEGQMHTLYPGQVLLVQSGVWHSFWTDTGVIFEEISTTDHNNDSTYRDPAINNLARSERKTVVDHWGRFQVQIPGSNSVRAAE